MLFIRRNARDYRNVFFQWKCCFLMEMIDLSKESIFTGIAG
nr:MAG TPA: hypothetical protein [Caudoviricetes sp.]